jgi:hypothetical protein
MKRLAIPAVLLAVAVGLAGCPAGPPMPSFRVLNGSYFLETRDLCIDGTKVENDIVYGELTPWYNYAPGAHTVTTTGAFAPCSAADAGITPTLETGETYTAVYTGDGLQSYLWFVNDAVRPPAGKAKLRFINVCMEAAVDLSYAVAISNPPNSFIVSELFDDVPTTYNSTVPPTFFYKTVNAGTYNLQVRDDDSDPMYVELGPTELESQGIYTVVVYGGSSAYYEAVVLEDH